MNPIAIDPKLRLTGVLLGFAIALAAVVGGYATVNAISNHFSSEGAPLLNRMMSLIEDDASMAQSDYETASGGDPSVAVHSAEFHPSVADAPATPASRRFMFWPDRDGQLSAKDWIRAQLVRLPDGAAAYLNSSTRTTWVIQLVRTFKRADGRTCREFSVTAKAPTRSEELVDSACRGAFGSWESNHLGVL